MEPNMIKQLAETLGLVLEAGKGRCIIKEQSGKVLLNGDTITQAVPWLCGAAWVKGISLPEVRLQSTKRPQPPRRGGGQRGGGGGGGRGGYVGGGRGAGGGAGGAGGGGAGGGGYRGNNPRPRRYS